MTTSPRPDDDAVLDQLARVLASPDFRRAARSSALLRYVVERTLAGDADRLKEYTLGAEALDRGPGFDPRIDPTVRAEVSRLRERLARYYKREGAADLIVFELPRGSYVPRVVTRATTPADAAPPTPTPPDAPAAAPTREPVRLHAAARPWMMAAWALMTLGLVGVGAWGMRGAFARGARPATQPLVEQYDADLRADAILGSEVGPDIVLTADGRRVVFVARDSTGVSWLYVRRLDQATAVRLPGTAGARVPFTSPDGRWVGFWAGGKVKRTALDGGSPTVLCDATDVLGASWGTDGQIVAAINPTGRLWQIPEGGGAPRPLMDLSGDAAMPAWPQLLPGGGAVVYTTLGGAGADRANVEAYALRDGTRHVLVRGGTFGRYLPGGYLSYVNQGTLYVAPFDSERLMVRGPAIPLVDDVAYSRTFGYAQLDAARSGTLVYRRTAGHGQMVVDWVDRAGRRATLLAAPGRYQWPSLSRDGRQLALSLFESGVSEVAVHDLGTGDVRHQRTGTVDPSGLLWWPDASLLLLGGRDGLASTAAGGPTGGPLHRLTDGTRIQVPWSLGPGATRLAFHQMDRATGFDLWTVPLKRAADSVVLGAPEPFLRTAAFEVYPTFSPDGRWIAYGSNEAGPYGVYVRRFPDDGSRVRIASDGGFVPRWSPNGRELLYQTNDRRVMVAPYRIEAGAFIPGTPRPWSSERLGDTGVFPGFDVAPDGERIVALLPAGRADERQAPNHVTFLLHFLDEVQRRVAAAR